jgi:hypothetical protein
MSSDLFLGKIDEILKRQLTQKSFDLWIGIRENIEFFGGFVKCYVIMAVEKKLFIN